MRDRAQDGATTLGFDHGGEVGRSSGYNPCRDLRWLDRAVHGDACPEALGSFEPLDPC